MKKYVCLIYHEETEFDRMTEGEHSAMQADSLAYDRLLYGQGKLVTARALRAPQEARKVRVRRRKAIITDGPFSETKEQLIGFLIIEAEDMAGAIGIAGEIPLARTGIVEIRETYSIDPERA